tara:strand:+ start:112 stop:453 length:342 start_codon:yes stop_codon:yes gene_type:complete
MASRDTYQAGQTIRKLNDDVNLKEEQKDSLANAMTTAFWAGRVGDAAIMMQALGKVNAQASMEEAARQQAESMQNMANATAALVEQAKAKDNDPPAFDIDALAAKVAAIMSTK